MPLLFLLLLLVPLVLSGCKPSEPVQPAALTLLQENALHLALSPANVPVETPLTLTLSGADVVAVSGELTGVSMYMGKIPLRFSQHGDNWQAVFLLGACSDADMQWQLQMELVLADGQKHSVKQQFRSSWH